MEVRSVGWLGKGHFLEVKINDQVNHPANF